MKGQARSLVYLALALALLGIFFAGGEAWARALPKPSGQTIPTPTPKGGGFTPTIVVPTVTPEPGVTTAPGQTPAPGITAAPGQTPLPGATLPPPAAGGTLALTKKADQSAVWPGMTATFTLTLANTGAASLRQVTIEDRLPAGLEPGAILAGPGAAWNGRVLRVSVPVLAPGGKLTVVYTARVRADIAPDAVLVNQAVASASGGQQAVAFVVLGQPPLELPPTGGAAAGRPR